MFLKIPMIIMTIIRKFSNIIIIMINYELSKLRVFKNYVCLKVLLFNFFIGWQFEEIEFWPAAVFFNGNCFLGFSCFQYPTKMLHSSDLYLWNWQIWKCLKGHVRKFYRLLGTYLNVRTYFPKYGPFYQDWGKIGQIYSE